MLKGIRFLQGGWGLRPVAATGLALAAAFLVAACGDEEGAPGSSPAALVPADASLYLEAVVKPEGDQGEEAKAALEQLLQTDDLGEFAADLEIFSHADEINFNEVEPLLGERLAVFAGGEGASGSDPPLAGIVESDDPDALLDLVLDSIEGEAEEVQHGEVTIHVAGEVALTVTGDNLIAGSEQGVREALDAQTGDAFDETDTYAEEVEDLRDGSVAALYAEPEPLLDLIVSSGEITAAQRRVLGTPAWLGVDPDQPVAAKLEIDDDSFKFALDAGAVEGLSAVASDLIDGIPADSWLGMAVTDVGTVFDMSVESLRVEDKAFGTSVIEQLERALEDAAGISLGELGEGLGDAAFFMGGASIFDINGALVVDASDEDAAASLVETAREALGPVRALRVGDLRIEGEGFSLQPASAPVPFSVVQRGSRVVAGGLGDEAVEAAFEPEEPLGESERYEEITGELGDRLGLAMFLDFAPLQTLLESIPGVGGDPDYETAKPYIDQLGMLIVGGAEEGDRAKTSMVLTLRDPE